MGIKEAWYRLTYQYLLYEGYEREKDMKIVRAAINSIEIIKEKFVDVGFIMICATVEEYNDMHDIKLTKKEFKSLKEVFCCE